jgi:hypothetical protein
MLQLVKSEKLNNGSRPNYLIIELCDDSLAPVARTGDYVLIAQYAAPRDGDLVAYQDSDETFVRWWRQFGSTVNLSDAYGNERIINLADILVLGVAREIRRPIVNGAPPQFQALEIQDSSVLWICS